MAIDDSEAAEADKVYRIARRALEMRMRDLISEIQRMNEVCVDSFDEYPREASLHFLSQRLKAFERMNASTDEFSFWVERGLKLASDARVTNAQDERR